MFVSYAFFEGILWSGSVLLVTLFANSHEFDQSGSGRTYSVQLYRNRLLSVTNKDYLSVCMPPILMKDHFKLFNISSVRAGTLLKGLSPGIVRVGGTEGDLLTFLPPSSQDTKAEISRRFDLPAVEDDSCSVAPEVLALYENADLICKVKYNFTITGEDWDKLNEFVQKNGMKLLFGFSALKRRGSAWDPTNALEILNYTLGKTYQNNLHFELGNEPNSYLHKFNFTLSARDHALDFKRLYTILRDEEPYKTAFHNALLVGPDITQPNKRSTLHYLQQFLAVGGKYLNKVTFHQYYISAKSPWTCISNFTDPVILDSLQQEFTATNALVSAAGFGRTRVWMGETDSASGGGVKGVSDRYVAGFMWLDKLGMAAENGVEVVIRQAFNSGNYALINKHNEPNPDYWLSWVYKQLVGEKVLNVSCSDSTRKTRVYAHCSAAKRYRPGSVTFYAMNLHTADIKLEFPPDLQEAEKEVYLMTPSGHQKLTSKKVKLNGKTLELVDDETFPELTPKSLPVGHKVTVPSLSYLFVVMPQANWQLCL